MQRIKLTIQYDGTNFVGWQKQKNGRSVQEEIEKAIQKVTGEQVILTGSSRTDAKVHALGQVAHFDLYGDFPAERLLFALNDALCEDVRIVDSKRVGNDFNARFDVKKKTYKYCLQLGQVQNPIKRNYAGHTNYVLNFEQMQKCADVLIGKYNFKGFCSSQAQVKNFERTILKIKITKNKDLIYFEFTGDGFLQHMVRILVGTLVDVGRGKLSIADVENALKFGDRKKAGKTMSPQGLCLMKIYF